MPQNMLTVLVCITVAASPPLTAPVFCSSSTNTLEGPLCWLWNLQQLASPSWLVLCLNFYDFIERSVLPAMMPFDGVNRRSILIMDDASIHHVHRVQELVDTAGCLL